MGCVVLLKETERVREAWKLSVHSEFRDMDTGRIGQ